MAEKKFFRATLSLLSSASLAFITGTPAVGQVLTANTASSITAISWQWQRNGSPIAGATSQTYTVQSADQGATITVQINGGAYSASVGIPAAAGRLYDTKRIGSNAVFA